MSRTHKHLRRTVLLVLSCSAFALADDPPKGAKPAPSPDVTTAPRAEDFLVIPLRVHILKSDTLPEVNCSLTDDDIRRIVGKVNKVWSVAGVHFGLESIRREPASGEAKFKLARDLDGNLPLGLFKVLIPKDSRDFEGQHVYYIHKFSVNGVYLGNNTSFVQETAGLRPVPGGIDEPLPRVTAHELGHALSLPHRQNRTNLLASGTTGTILNRAEVDKAYEAASELPGVLSHGELKAAIKGAKGKDDAARLEGWLADVESLAKSGK